MIKKDNLYTGQDAREKLTQGIKKCANAVGITMGTGGSNSLIEAIEHPGHMMTNDGATILASIRLADAIEEMGRKILLEAVSRANKANGDGSSTTAVLTSAILEEGKKQLGKVSPMEIKRSLENCIPLIEESIKKQKRKITVDKVGPVATISAEDEGIGQTIQEIYKQIGKDGIIHWDISKTSEDSYTIGKGITIEGAGFYSPYMCDADQSGQNTNQIRIKNPTVLITKQKIASAGDFETVASTLNGKEIKDLVVFCDEIEPLVVPDIVKTRMIQGFRIVLVKMPILWKDQWYEDIALASGAKIVDPSAGLPMKNLTLEHLGTFENITITKEATYIDGVKDLSIQIKTLEEEATDSSKLRASRLNTKTARYFVGAHSDSALSYRRLKVEDAISAAWHALQGGVVAGGGVALINAGATLPEGIGRDILKPALEAPACQIYLNAGARVPDMFLYNGTDVGGFDSRIGKEVGDMFEAGIIDPADVVLNAVKNAVSVAASVLTANTVITLPREENERVVMPNGAVM